MLSTYKLYNMFSLVHLAEDDARYVLSLVVHFHAIWKVWIIFRHVTHVVGWNEDVSWLVVEFEVAVLLAIHDGTMFNVYMNMILHMIVWRTPTFVATLYL